MLALHCAQVRLPGVIWCVYRTLFYNRSPECKTRRLVYRVRLSK